MTHVERDVAAAAEVIERLLHEIDRRQLDLHRLLERWRLQVRLPRSRGQLLTWPRPKFAGQPAGPNYDEWIEHVHGCLWRGREKYLSSHAVAGGLEVIRPAEIVQAARTPSAVLDIIETLEYCLDWLQARIEGVERHGRACLEHDARREDLRARLTLEGLR